MYKLYDLVTFLSLPCESKFKDSSKSIYVIQMDILLNGVLVEELSTIVHASRLEYTARHLTTKLKEMIPRQMVQVILSLDNVRRWYRNR